MAGHVGGNLWNAQKGNFGPQVGFNWSPGLFHNNMTVRGGFGLNFNQSEIAVTSSTFNNPPSTNYVNFAFQTPTNPGTNGAFIQYGISSSPTSFTGYAANTHAITSYNAANLPTAGNANITIIGDGHGNLPTTYSEQCSLDTEYQFAHDLVASLGYEGSLGRNITNHQTPNAPAVVQGFTLNPLVTGGDFWTNIGSSNNNALLAELKHPFAHHLKADAQVMWAKSLDTDGSGPYYEDPTSPRALANLTDVPIQHRQVAENFCSLAACHLQEQTTRWRRWPAAGRSRASSTPTPAYPGRRTRHQSVVYCQRLRLLQPEAGVPGRRRNGPQQQRV